MSISKIIWALFLMATGHALMHENVFFHKVGEFSMSRSKWLISFVIDLSTYERFLDRLTIEIQSADDITDHIISQIKDPKQLPTDRYKAILGGLKGQLSVIKGIHNDIKDSFNDYKLLQASNLEQSSRKKRKVFGFIGDLMSDVFGVVTEGGVLSITRNIERLDRNQKEITHVVEESLSILNVSRIEIRQNRQKINDLIQVVGTIEDKVINMSNELHQQIRDIWRGFHIFAKLDSILEDIKNALARSMYFYTHFQLQIQAAAMQKLSPTTIPADIFRDLLLEIQDELPQTVGLPTDPRRQLFDYYKYLPCTPIFDGKHIVISIKVPLVEYSQQFDIFRAYSLPVPLLGRTQSNSDGKKLLAYYKLESNYLAINSDRSQYILMDENDVQLCIESGMQICNIKSPVRNANMAHYCILSAFSQNKIEVSKNCRTWIHQTILPTAFYLANDVYLVITDTTLVFHLSCDKKDNGRSKVDPPFGFLTLHKNCIATSNYFSLMGYYENSTRKEIPNPANIMLKDYNITDVRVWDDINTIVPFDNKSFKLPSKLANLEDFPLGNLMVDLKHRENIEPMKIEHFPTLGYVIIVVVVVPVLIFLAVCCCKQNLRLTKLSFCHNRNKPKVNRAPAVIYKKSDPEAQEELTSLTEVAVAVPTTNIIKKKFETLDKK